MNNAEGILQVIGELRVLGELQSEKVNRLTAALRESEANIRSLMDENKELQEKLTLILSSHEAMRNKYETQVAR